MMIPVTKPYFPPQEQYSEYISQIWENQWLTNNGEFVQIFEQALGQYLQTDIPLLVTNGTMALQLCLKLLKSNSEIITTPFSYVATTSSIVWENCKPIFADIDENTLNIDSELVEGLITERTTAILATHCFGNACDIDRLEKIAKKNDIRLIFDAAHCFGTLYKGRSIFEYGDLSTCSLHATKLMHSGEGGLIFSKDSESIDELKYLRNFGHEGYESFHGLGVNGKMSELHAALGLCVLKDIPEIRKRRKEQVDYYDNLLETLNVSKPAVLPDCQPNNSYYPIIFSSTEACVNAQDQLLDSGILARRYFYPSLNTLNYVEFQSTPISEFVSSRILCLPLFHDLTHEIQDRVANILFKTQPIKLA